MILVVPGILGGEHPRIHALLSSTVISKLFDFEHLGKTWKNWMFYSQTSPDVIVKKLTRQNNISEKGKLVFQKMQIFWHPYFQGGVRPSAKTSSLFLVHKSPSIRISTSPAGEGKIYRLIYWSNAFRTVLCMQLFFFCFHPSCTFNYTILFQTKTLFSSQHHGT